MSLLSSNASWDKRTPTTLASFPAALASHVDADLVELDSRRSPREEPMKKEETHAVASLSGEHSDDLIKQLSKHHLIYSILGLVLGLVCVIGGLLLFLQGVS